MDETSSKKIKYVNEEKRRGHYDTQRCDTKMTEEKGKKEYKEEEKKDSVGFHARPEKDVQ
jgi:hypothetical protein